MFRYRMAFVSFRAPAPAKSFFSAQPRPWDKHRHRIMVVRAKECKHSEAQNPGQRGGIHRRIFLLLFSLSPFSSSHAMHERRLHTYSILFREKQ
jgi:hypothetical protein